MGNIINGSRIPDVELGRLLGSELCAVSTRELFAHGRTIVLGIPGAFTPVCTKEHVPDFIKNAGKLKACGYTQLICIAPNDPFVLDAWARQVDPKGKIEFFSDGNLDFVSRLDLRMTNRDLFVGVRSERYLMIVHNNTIVRLRVEPNILAYTCTRAVDALNDAYTEI